MMAKVTVALAYDGESAPRVTHPCHHVLNFTQNRSKIINLSFKMQKFCACGAISSYIQLHPATPNPMCIFTAMFTACKMAKVGHALGLRWRKWAMVWALRWRK